MPVNFSLTDLGPTHIISAEAILAITFVIYHNNGNEMSLTFINLQNAIYNETDELCDGFNNRVVVVMIHMIFK